MTDDVTADLPSLGLGNIIPARLVLLAPIPLTTGLFFCLESRLEHQEGTSVRPVRALDMYLILSSAFLAFALAALLEMTGGSHHSLAAARNVLFFVGLLLIFRPVLGQGTSVLPMAWVCVVFLTGYRSPRDPYPWSIIPEPLGAVHAWIGALGAFGLGTLFHFFVSSRRGL
ncbi:hypothetical protein [Streptomyces sp. DSM 40750]|uniref:hypothetical protein n=1 Tax=Streptomyces sp. DSM 40750 TaxID=2801030 RepID=UPI00214B2690|nr:hypothetical protein [Streptomyces sp. DSM 40750]UUU24691.1 hypothetical protein JIX55_33030 [Streptomyces sp. DSM 40750]